MAREATLLDAPAIAAAWILVRDAVASWWPEAVAEQHDAAHYQAEMASGQYVFYISNNGKAFFRVYLGSPPPDGADRTWEEMDTWIWPPGLSRRELFALLRELFIAWATGARLRANWCWGTLPVLPQLDMPIAFARSTFFSERPHPSKAGWRIWEFDPSRLAEF